MADPQESVRGRREFGPFHSTAYDGGGMASSRTVVEVRIENEQHQLQCTRWREAGEANTAVTGHAGVCIPALLNVHHPTFSRPPDESHTRKQPSTTRQRVIRRVSINTERCIANNRSRC